MYQVGKKCQGILLQDEKQFRTKKSCLRELSDSIIQLNIFFYSCTMLQVTQLSQKLAALVKLRTKWGILALPNLLKILQSQ